MEDQMHWLRIGSDEEIETVLLPALNQIQFDTSSGYGHREKRLGRLLTMVGQRGGQERTTQLLGIIFPDIPSLQQKALDMIAGIYASRHNGQSIHTWLPK